jgi:hypothetical protein
MAKFKKIAIYVVSGLVILFIGSGIGSSGAKVTLNEKKVNAEQLDKEITSLKADKKKEIGEVSKAKKEHKDIFDTIANKDKAIADQQKAKQDLDVLNGQLKDIQSKIDQANNDLKSKQDELASVSGQIVKAQGDPKKLGAGQYIVGKDIPAGRYTAHALGSGSNFFVYDGSSGSAKVNTILGNEAGLGSGDYTFFCSDNDIIETHESVQLTPVQ